MPLVRRTNPLIFYVTSSYGKYMNDKTSNLTQERRGVFSVTPGAGITVTIAEAIERSKRENRPITFNFSDVPVTVVPESDPETIRCEMQRAWEELHGGATS
jgi:hypothetical protein